MNMLPIVLGLSILARCHASLLRAPRTPASAPQVKSGGAFPSGQLDKEAAPITLFCFAFFPRRPMDDEKLPEARLQLESCDGHLFFTDEEAPGPPAADIVRVKVAHQPLPRDDKIWLYHRNMAGLTPVWTYLLAGDLLAKFDWVLNVEVDHFTRPSKVRSAILGTLQALSQGSEWERSFFATASSTSGSNSSADGAAAKPMMLAFGNAFAFSKLMVAEMGRQWPLPGLAVDGGCPGEGWPINQGGGHNCEQDVVYRDMLRHFEPPVQVFGTFGCGKRQKTHDGIPLPFACWEFLQNPYGAGEVNQIAAIRDIATGIGHEPPSWDSPNEPIQQKLLFNQTHDEDEAHWETFIPPRDIPIIHHAMNSAVLREARMKLGL